MRQTALFLVLLLAVPAARAEEDEEAGQVLIAYQASVGAHQISGVSHALQWNATALAPDGAQVRLRVPIDSFESGHPGFDALLKAAAEAERYPFIEVEGVARGGRFEGTLALRGVSRPLQIHIGVVQSAGHWVTNATFTLDLNDFGISLPSVGRRIAVDFVSRFPVSPQAVIGGGAVSSAD
jgi:polyisoprenoid-binding protein YceI